MLALSGNGTIWHYNLYLWVQDVYKVQQVQRTYWKKPWWKKPPIFTPKIPKYTDTLVLWFEKDDKFSDKPLLKADALGRAHFSECNSGIFLSGRKVYQYATVPFCFWKRDPMWSVNTGGRTLGLSSKMLLMLWSKAARIKYWKYY